MRSLLSTCSLVLTDEPENHLHPELQTCLLPSLIQAFPRAQFIVATHNPFIVSSVANSNVYVLDFLNRRVESTMLDLVDKSGSSNALLRDVLALPNPIPVWVVRPTGSF